MVWWKSGDEEITPTEDPQGDRHELASGHRSYGSMVDGDGNTVRNWSNYGVCHCGKGGDHDG